jgi:hypothetical protein
MVISCGSGLNDRMSGVRDIRCSGGNAATENGITTRQTV